MVGDAPCGLLRTTEESCSLGRSSSVRNNIRFVQISSVNNLSNMDEVRFYRAQPGSSHEDPDTNRQQSASSSSKWSTWTQCTKTCGGGTRTRSKLCQGSPCPGSKPKKDNCNTQSCDLGQNCSHWLSSCITLIDREIQIAEKICLLLCQFSLL